VANKCSLINFTEKEPKDWMVPSRWGTVCNHQMSMNLRVYADRLRQIDKRDDPYAPQQSGGCCTVM